MSDAARAQRSDGAAGGLALGLGLLWLPVLWRLRLAWNIIPEQAFGWTVPLLAGALFMERARRRPAPGAIGAGAGKILTGGLIAALLVLPVLLTVLEANPLWPLAQWLAWLTAAGVTLAVLALAGGARWAGYFAFPVLFSATALTWPTVLSNTLVQALVAMNANLAAETVSALGHPAMVHGAVIELAHGFVGIDEACSGLRSLQAVWMVGWFGGELLRLRATRRVVLVVGSVAAALTANWLRTTALTWIAAAHGPAASEHWHDRMGTIELIGALAAVAALGWWLARGKKTAAQADSLALWPVLRRGVVVGLVVAALAAAAGPEGWYRAHEGGERVQWQLASAADGWESYEIPARTKELLQASTTAGLVRREPDGGRAYALAVTWGDDVARAAAAEWHDPTICLPASGAVIEGAPTTCTIELDGVAVDFTEMQFIEGQRRQRVFYCHWDAWLGRARAPVAPDMVDVPAWRLERVAAGRRRGDAAYLALVVPEADEAAAQARLREWAPRIFHRK
ncbi:MAG: archaeosortase/exosortase family protein [Verrucomicrobia bacterium]|nr:archaeosortase/exosortase family protein [Verrucomicrobiota bacterium]